ncbi:P-loop NTPase fold protein [Spiroplasma endosymbiont of Nebria brevicollis]|uniref:P-loop NTPase fold protein n=1 Tax=Spiroplasma endosymbiont of Nebria brevicollis TaxID=3066284 RepID=UPI00313DB128
MIMNLKFDNDKMNMIPIIKLINKRIKLFFDNLKLNKKINLNDEQNINNILNINGSWGSGKSTIINNLEKYWKFKNEKPIFIIINLWEYEIIKDIIRNIKPFIKNDNENIKNSKIKNLVLQLKTQIPVLLLVQLLKLNLIILIKKIKI